MQSSQFKRSLSQIYLKSIPFLTIIIGVAFGHTNYKIYVPLGILNACLMVFACRMLIASAIKKQDAAKNQLVLIGFLLIIPWMLLAMLAGLGPPPFSEPAEYVASGTEQQVRYSFLLISGMLIGFGFAILRENLKKTEEHFYSWLGLIAILMAIPLFVVNMAFYNSFFLETFRIVVSSGSNKMPEWFLPIKSAVVVVMVVEVALTYLATAAFAASLKAAGWFDKTASHIYITVGILSCISAVFSTFLPEPIATGCSIVCIPALPFIMPYFMGINLLKRAGNG
ncbi:MAG: hypothetical protein ACHQET_07200 [Chitinophagales bacterium]